MGFKMFRKNFTQCFEHSDIRPGFRYGVVPLSLQVIILLQGTMLYDDTIIKQSFIL